MSQRNLPLLALSALALVTACGDNGTNTTAATEGNTTGNGPTTANPPTTSSEPTTDPQPTSTSTSSTSSASATGDSSTGIDPANPTAMPVTTGDPMTTDPMTTGPTECEEGSEQCKRGAHQVCQQGVFVDAPCDPGQFCDEMTESCQDCTCEPGATGTCADEDNINVCNADCGGYTPEPCPGGTHLRRRRLRPAAVRPQPEGLRRRRQLPAVQRQGHRPRPRHRLRRRPGVRGRRVHQRLRAGQADQVQRRLRVLGRRPHQPPAARHLRVRLRHLEPQLRHPGQGPDLRPQ
jgi:hypothetical protein